MKYIFTQTYTGCPMGFGTSWFNKQYNEWIVGTGAILDI